MQDDVQLVYRRRCESGVEAVPVEPTHLGGVEVLELDAPEGGRHGWRYSVLVSFVGAPAYRVPNVL
jgi:hypothetical protein